MPGSKHGVTIHGLAKMQRRLSLLPAQARKAASDAAKAETLEVASVLRSTAPVDTGFLSKSVESEYDGKRIKGKAYVTARYAHFVNDGTSENQAQPWATIAAEQSRARFPKRMKLAVKLMAKKLARS